MKHAILFSFFFIPLTSISSQTGKPIFGLQIHPAIELNEIGSGIQLGGSLSAGFYYKRFHFSLYYFQNFQNAQIMHLEAYQRLETEYAERGVRFEYVLPIKYYLNIMVGLRLGQGLIDNDILSAKGAESIEEQRIFQFRPEAGAEISLNPSMRLSFLAAYRSIYGLEELEDGINTSHFNSLVTSLGLRFVL